MDEVHSAHGGVSFDDVGVRFASLERRHEIVNADVLDAWFDASPRVLDKLREHLPWLARTSPPVHAEGLIATLSAVRGVPESSLVTGAGSSDLIFRLLPRLARGRHRALLLDPTYGEYVHVLERLLGLEVARFDLDAGSGFRIDPAALAAAAAGCDLVVLVNPNNPTGTALGRRDVLALRESMPAGSVLVVDETYVDWLPEGSSVERDAARRDDLVVIKSMSKFYGLSGLRVGYAVTAPALAGELRTWTPPWNVSLPAQVAAVAALEDDDYYRARARETDLLRASLAESLRAIPGLEVFDACANFLLLRLPSGAPSSAVVCARTRELGVHLRDCDSQSRRFAGRFVRTAVKDAADNRRIADALRAALT